MLDPCTEEELRKILMAAPAKSCSLDPIPTWLLRKCLNVLLPVLVRIINKSLQLGEVPASMKYALITPLLKKPSLDQNEMSNYRPISNLTFLSKLLERVVALRLKQHMASEALYEPHQSAYREHHSTETVLVKVVNDILCALDSKQEAVLVMLDLSAAFDTVDHTLLLSRLQNRIGLSGSALEWFTSYLSDRMVSVCVNGCSSESVVLSTGVPQGSVLGPVLFNVYTLPLGDVMRVHDVHTYEMFADDNQLLGVFPSGDVERGQSSVTNVESCIQSIGRWLIANNLCFNGPKTECMAISSARGTPSISSIKVDGVEIKSSDFLRDLGGWLDSHMDMTVHVKKVCQSAFSNLHSIGRIRKYLDTASTKKLVHALVTSRLDYNNALLYGLPKKAIAPLQRVQNAAARLISKTRKRDHITPVLKDLHWLPVHLRIEYKVIVLTHKILRGQAPVYLTELVKPMDCRRNTRSMDTNSKKLSEKRTRTAYGDRSFVAASARLWNRLPRNLSCIKDICPFKRHLKCYLYTLYFGQ